MLTAGAGTQISISLIKSLHTDSQYNSYLKADWLIATLNKSHAVRLLIHFIRNS